MLTHVVMIKLKQPSAEQAADLVESLLALEGQVPTLRRMEAGVDTLHQDRSYDLALIARFDDVDGLNAYQVHPAHQAVLAVVREVASAVVAVDYIDEESR